MRLRLLPLLAEGLRPVSSEGLELVPPPWEKTSDGLLVVLSEYLQDKYMKTFVMTNDAKRQICVLCPPQFPCLSTSSSFYEGCSEWLTSLTFIQVRVRVSFKF